MPQEQEELRTRINNMGVSDNRRKKMKNGVVLCFDRFEAIVLTQNYESYIFAPLCQMA